MHRQSLWQWRRDRNEYDRGLRAHAVRRLREQEEDES
jgi:hypothetical protein